MDASNGVLTDEPGIGQQGLRGRAVISRHHRQLLEGVYARNPRPSTAELDRVAVQMTGVPRRVVRVWFQNKRARDRRRGRRSTSESSSGSTAKTPVTPIFRCDHACLFVIFPQFSPGNAFSMARSRSEHYAVSKPADRLWRLRTYQVSSIWRETPVFWSHLPLTRRITKISRISTTKFGQLIISRLVKIVATRCHILRLKCTKFDFGWGSAPDPARGARAHARTLLPTPPSWI